MDFIKFSESTFCNWWKKPLTEDGLVTWRGCLLRTPRLVVYIRPQQYSSSPTTILGLHLVVMSRLSLKLAIGRRYVNSLSFDSLIT